MLFEDVMRELESLATPQTKKRYASQGVREPYWGVPTTAMKPLSRKIGRNQQLAEQLYATGNYDAMYFAGVIADPQAMTPAGFDRWIDDAYCYMLGDYVVAVTLAETGFAQEVADRWIVSGDELRASAGWACYEWLLGSRPDCEFDCRKIAEMLTEVTKSIADRPSRVRHSMKGFVVAVGVSYLPLHDEALAVAEKIAAAVAGAISKAADKGRIGFKRKAVRC